MPCHTCRCCHGRLDGGVIELVDVVIGLKPATWQSVWNTAETETTFSVAWGDYDGDGDLDLAAGNEGASGRPNRLHDGNGTFVSEWDALRNGVHVFGRLGGIATAMGTSISRSGIQARRSRDLPRNNGNSTFVSVWNSVETEGTRSLWGDYDGDGDLDLAAGNAYETNRAYRNNGNGTFVSVWNSIDQTSTSMIAWGDYDGDGDLDFTWAITLNTTTSIETTGIQPSSGRGINERWQYRFNHLE